MMQKVRKAIDLYKNMNLVVKAGLWFMLVTVIDKGIAVITQPIINRILTVDEVGTFGVYTSWRSVFAVLATFNLFGGVLEVYLTKQKDKKNSIVASLCSLSILIAFIFWSVFFLFGTFFSNLLGIKKIYFLIMAIAVTSDAIIQFWAVPKRFEYSYKIYAIIIVGLFATKSFLSVLLTYLMKSERILGRLLGLVIPNVCVALILLFIIIRKTEKEAIFQYWKRGLLFNLPLIPHYLSSILLASSDRIMIQKLSSNSDAGLYTVSYSFASLALIVFSALNSTYNPISMKAIKNKEYDVLKSSTNIIVLLSVVFSIFMMLLAPEGLWLLGGDEYLSSLDIIPVLIVGIFFSSFYFVFSNVEFVYEKNKLIFPITLIGAVINIVLNFTIIPLLGYKVAAYTTFIGYLFIAVAHYIASRKIIGEDIYNIKKLALLVCFLILGGVISMLLYECHYIIRYIVLVILTIILVYVGLKNKNALLKMVIKKKENS